METCWDLPKGYRQTDYFNLRRDRKRSRWLNLTSGLIGAAMVALGWGLERFHALSQLLKSGFGDYYLWLALLLCAMLLYLTLHELTHGLFLRIYTGQVRYARKGLTLFAGSEAYLSRRDFLLSLLAPVVLWGLLLAVICCFVSGIWFWLVYGLEIVNLGSSVGDLYLAAKAWKLPKTALYQNFGVSVYVYTEEV